MLTPRFYSTIRDLEKLGIGIETSAAGISIPASGISIRYQSIPVPGQGPFNLVPDCS
jgi:hypothetical protein